MSVLDPFPHRPVLLGMVHLGPLPGSPRFDGSFQAILDAAVADAEALVDGGVDGLMVENFGDAPFYPGTVSPLTVACLTRAARRVVTVAGNLPVGINVLRCDPEAALSVAVASGARFIRVNVHVGAALTDQGIIQGRAHQTLRERAAWARGIAILADVSVKHSRPLAPGDELDEARETYERGLADGLILSGTSTGAPVDPELLARIRKGLPEALLLLGSGVTHESAEGLLVQADGAIVGTALKEEGRLDRPVCMDRVRRMRTRFDGARKNR